jgi:hypothetical protein
MTSASIYPTSGETNMKLDSMIYEFDPRIELEMAQLLPAQLNICANLAHQIEK